LQVTLAARPAINQERPMDTADHSLEDILRLRAAVDSRLTSLVPPAEQAPAALHQSMRHSLLAPGKRVRALLLILTTKHFGGVEELAMSSACAVEMVHAASLILDDLPAMDNATLRRGLPANHRVYGEATAILAAIALMNRAFGVIAEDRALPEAARVRLTDILSRAIGSEGLVAGQEADLKWQPIAATRKDVELVHMRKTAALFAAATEMGAVAAGTQSAETLRMRDFGERLGLAFQVLDDLIDVLAAREEAGKDVDRDAGKPSMVHTVGLEEAQREARLHIDGATSLVTHANGTPGVLGDFALSLMTTLQKSVNSHRSRPAAG
jgi:geranylgeranyl diphosphate synthase, type II